MLVCIKRVPDAAGEVLLTADEQAVDARFVGFTVSAHESCAVELAVRIAGGGRRHRDRAHPRARRRPSSSCAPRWASAARPAVLIEADPSGFGPADVASEIAAVVAAHAAEGRTYDLILLGNDAADTGDFQVGIRLAYELGRPVVNGVRTVEVAGSIPTGSRPRAATASTASRPTRCRCPPSSPCWRAASSRATRRSPAG